MDLNIFTEAFLARMLPVYSEVTLGAIRHFKLEEYPPSAALAAVGGLLALAIYYAVGIWLRRMPERVSTEEQRARIEKMRGAAREWLPWLLVLSPTPLGGVVVMAAGTGNPYFTTDTAAALRGAEIGAQIVLKATKVDGVYTADPKKDPQAQRYHRISFDEAIGRNLQVLDSTAFALCRDQKLPINVFSIFKPGALKRVVMGEDEGTLVHS